MRKVNYEVRRPDGRLFITTDYKVATSNGNRIEKTFLTPVKAKEPPFPDPRG